MPSLYIVATPIGNLKDITVRALETLREVDTIVCEDTRHSIQLLKAFEIRKPLLSCHGYNEEKAATQVINELKAGKNLAYISDAGTPGVSDPGGILSAAVHAAGFPVVPIPGPSALAAILSVAGIPGKRVCFDGFLSPKSGRRKSQLKDLLASGDICVVYESPFRIIALLQDLSEIDPICQCVLGRELTKLHEEIIRGTPADLLATLGAKPAIKGEIVLAMHSAPKRVEKVRHGADYFKDQSQNGGEDNDISEN